MGRRNKTRALLGFTLAETLVAILIMLMVASVATAGIPAARNAYDKAVSAANAQTLLSTAVTTLRSELSTAPKIEKQGPLDSSDSVTYYRAGSGVKAKLYLDKFGSGESEKTIMLQEGIPFDSNHATIGSPAPQVFIQPLGRRSAADMSGCLYVTYRSIDIQHLADGYLTIQGLQVNQASGLQNLASLDELVIRVIAAS